MLSLVFPFNNTGEVPPWQCKWLWVHVERAALQFHSVCLTCPGCCLFSSNCCVCVPAEMQRAEAGAGAPDVVLMWWCGVYCCYKQENLSIFCLMAEFSRGLKHSQYNEKCLFQVFSTTEASGAQKNMERLVPWKPSDTWDGFLAFWTPCWCTLEKDWKISPSPVSQKNNSAPAS